MIRGQPALLSRPFNRPVWFIQRDNGNYVPVLAVDELPSEVHLEGVPRSMNLDDAQGMKFLGHLRYTGQTYSLLARDQKVAGAPTAIGTPPTMAQTRHSDHHMGLQPKTSDKLGTVAKDEKPLSAVNEAKVKALPEVIARFNYTGQPPLPPSGKQPDQTKKEYCTYWIKTGGCDFTQQGCMYKHEMPDQKTLREKVGINYIPKWWIDKNPSCNPQPPTWMKERIRAHDAALMKLPPVQHTARDCDGSDADASSGSDDEQSRPSDVPRKTVDVACARYPLSFKAPDADHNQKAKDAGTCPHEPASDTELNYVRMPLAIGQTLHGALEHVNGFVGEAKAGSVKANPHRRNSSYSVLGDLTGRSPPKKEVNNFFKYIRTNGAPPPPNSPVAQGTTVVHQTPSYVKISPVNYRPTPTAASTTTTGASQSADHFNVSALKPKPLAIGSKSFTAGPASLNDLATQGGLHSSRHAPNSSSDGPSSHAQHQHLRNPDIDDFGHDSLVNSATSAPHGGHCVTPMEAHYAIDNGADSEGQTLVSERDSSSSINSSSSSSGSGGRGTRTRSSSVDWDSEVPSFEPSSIVESARCIERSPKASHAVPRGKLEKRVPRQKPTGGSSPGSGYSTGITTPSAPREHKHSSGARGGVRPAKARRPAVAEADTVGNNASSTGLKSNGQRKEGKIVPTKIQRTKVVNHGQGGQGMRVQQVRMEVKQQRDV